MSSLALMTIALAVFMFIVYGLMIKKSSLFLLWMERFPRNIVAGRILVAVDLVWVFIILHQTDFGQFNWIKDLLVNHIAFLQAMPLGIFSFLKDLFFWVALISYFLITKYLAELLAPRALGGLLLLMASPILNAARWLDTPFRLVMVVVAYVLVIKGILLVLSPYKFRKWMALFFTDNKRCQLAGMIGIVFALFIGFLGVFVY